MANNTKSDSLFFTTAPSGTSRAHPLDVFFGPRTVAVIGASDNPRSVGRIVLRNLLNTPFGGTVYPVHPQQPQVLGIKPYHNLAAIPEPIDLAIIATPAPTVPAIIAECVAAKVRAAIMISDTFRENGDAGAAMEQQILEAVRGSTLRLLGPNALGVMRPHLGLNATFAATMPRAGEIAFVTQSGALGTAVLDWSIRENFGFSAFLSVGSMLDLAWGEVIDYLGADEKTASIVLYMETLGAPSSSASSARAFLSAARQVAFDKPIVILKAGRDARGTQRENDAVLDAAFRRAGALRVDSAADLFEMAQVLAKQPRPQGPRLAILTNAGGPGVLATDSLGAHGGELADLSDESLAQLDEILPLHWSHTNPVDMRGDAEPAHYGKAMDILARETNADGVLAILTPQAMTDPTASAEAIKSFARMKSKPLFAAWMGGAEVEVGANVLRAASVPVFPYPDQAARMFAAMWRYTENLNALYETPAPEYASSEHIARDTVQTILERARAAERTLLTEDESRRILTAYNIPFVETHLATTAAHAAKIADALGYPVVMKINSDKLIRKTEYGGVILNLTSAHNVRETFRVVKDTVTKLLGPEKFQGVLLQRMLNLKGGYALHIGSMLDAQFGPVLRFGAEKRPAPSDARGIPITADATTMLERDARYRDDAVALPPLTTTLARRMMENTRAYKILQEADVELAPLEQVLTRFSTLVAEQPWLKAIEIHPLFVLPPTNENESAQVLALDARILLHDASLDENDLPRLAIRPYPLQYVHAFPLRDGTPVVMRPIRADDETLLVRFHEKLSEQSVYLRYFHALNLSQRIAHERLSRIASIDYAREIALVVERDTPPSPALPKGGGREILAVARLTRRRVGNDAEFAILIRDDCQRQGLGTALLKQLIHVARAEKIERLLGEALPENIGIKHLAEKAGFTLTYDIEQAVTRLMLVL